MACLYKKIRIHKSSKNVGLILSEFPRKRQLVEVVYAKVIEKCLAVLLSVKC